MVEMEKVYMFHSFILMKTGLMFQTLGKKALNSLSFEYSLNGQNWEKHPDILQTGQ
jgi:hypothetical protein